MSTTLRKYQAGMAAQLPSAIHLPIPRPPPPQDMFAAATPGPEVQRGGRSPRPPPPPPARDRTAAMHKLASLSAELKSKVQDASSAISDVRQRVTQQMLEGTGYADKTDDEDFPELEAHVSCTSGRAKQRSKPTHARSPTASWTAPCRPLAAMAWWQHTGRAVAPDTRTTPQSVHPSLRSVRKRSARARSFWGGHCALLPIPHLSACPFSEGRSGVCVGIQSLPHPTSRVSHNQRTLPPVPHPSIPCGPECKGAFESGLKWEWGGFVPVTRTAHAQAEPFWGMPPIPVPPPHRLKIDLADTSE